MALAAPDDGARETELQILGRLKTDLLCVNPWGVRGCVSLQTADEKHIAEGAGDPRKQRYPQRLYAIDLKGVDIFRVVAPQKGATLRRPQPTIVFSKGDLVAQPKEGNVGLNDAKGINRGNRP